MKHFDYLAIGAGSGGIASINRAASHGKKCAVIEAVALGGTCVNVGCVPKKVMWYGAQVADAINLYANDYGFDVTTNKFDFAQLLKSRDSYIDRIHTSYGNMFKKNNVEVIQGFAKFNGKNSVEVNGETITADHILIATGGRPSIPKIEGAELGIDSNGFFALKQLPKSAIVVGAGYIAVELSGVLNSFGVETNLLVRKHAPCRSFDIMLTDAIFETFAPADKPEPHKPTIYTDAIPKLVTKTNDGVEVTLEDGRIIRAECLIWAIGRNPATDNLNLDVAGVELNERGYIKVDKYQNTSAKNIYAVGDNTGSVELTPVAVAAGRLLAERLFNNKPEAHLDYSLIPTVVFSHPPMGMIGINEQDARIMYGDDKIKVYTSNFTSMYTAVTQHRQPCHMKLICLGDEEKVIGLHGFGYGVDEMIQGFAVAIKMGATKADFDRTMAIHPTGSEEFVTMS